MTFINSEVQLNGATIPIQVALISAYLRPNSLMYKAMHNDYSEQGITKEIADGKIPSETECSAIIIKRLLKGNRGHFGVLEHCPLIFHLRGVNPFSLIVFKDKPSIVIREFPADSNIIYLKCNLRSFLAIMDYWTLVGTQSETLETTLNSMWSLFAEYVPTIADWYVLERKPYLLRKPQPIF